MPQSTAVPEAVIDTLSKKFGYETWNVTGRGNTMLKGHDVRHIPVGVEELDEETVARILDGAPFTLNEFWTAYGEYMAE